MLTCDVFYSDSTYRSVYDSSVIQSLANGPIQDDHLDGPKNGVCSRIQNSYSLVINTYHKPLYLRVVPGSHTWEESIITKEKCDSLWKVIPCHPGQCIIFYRTLVHSGYTYEGVHKRIHCFVDCYPRHWTQCMIRKQIVLADRRYIELVLPESKS